MGNLLDLFGMELQFCQFCLYTPIYHQQHHLPLHQYLLPKSFAKATIIIKILIFTGNYKSAILVNKTMSFPEKS